MVPDAKLSNWITEAIKQLITEESTEPAWSKSYAKRYDLLPLLHDWSASFGIRANGKIFFYATDSEEQFIREEMDERLRNLALYQGSIKYPELKPLVPNRPDDAMTCAACLGLGKFERDNGELSPFICFCGGLGWLPHGTQIPTG